MYHHDINKVFYDKRFQKLFIDYGAQRRFQKCFANPASSNR